jgi:hypothetical protein
MIAIAIVASGLGIIQLDRYDWQWKEGKAIQGGSPRMPLVAEAPNGGKARGPIRQRRKA